MKNHYSLHNLPAITLLWCFLCQVLTSSTLPCTMRIQCRGSMLYLTVLMQCNVIVEQGLLHCGNMVRYKSLCSVIALQIT
ncbi:hypothetical protein GDO86_008674 [Hymenochirus boettgeri]|uniref:Secreted protein n=1 Tax=Hymenochirus boettgeri TaxID=247094 RepID=A0A8T2IYN1_9PIPI|nr:hypothetical protein GDO86_008674 [Hymenochirus boettgeri]